MAHGWWRRSVCLGVYSGGSVGVLAGVGFGRVVLVVGGRCDGGGGVRCSSSRDIRVRWARGHVTRGTNS